MKRKPGKSVVQLIYSRCSAILTLTLLLLLAMPAVAQDHGRTRWEYLELYSYDYAGDQQDHIRLSTATETHDFGTASELCKKLTPQPKRMNLIYAMNLLGADGWELVSHTSTEDDRRLSNTQRWTFKRMVIGGK